ncbi:MAG: hypothetical protein PWP41_635 [Moorella sp. (in: firmicutes)]|uniref:Uncharacterized protein n=1 Tax=Neomoorella thermoacetica TaxID=1525 RepID=A0A1J5NPX3_NEOTH|nr:hypothetical protein [Moorella sp. (in: firmicutes)]OIQ60312.1 hypothetical protein MOTE_07130 [Moorella thermoacetica]
MPFSTDACSDPGLMLLQVCAPEIQVNKLAEVIKPPFND